jgi:hypothetical protein
MRNEPESLEICIEHDDLPPLLEGVMIPRIDVVYTMAQTQQKGCVPNYIASFDLNTTD